MLNKLPKDLLIKLVVTIREDTKKKYVELLRQTGSKTYLCEEQTCKAFVITNDYSGDPENDYVIFNSDNRKFRACSICKSNFCEIHDQIMECVSCKKLLCCSCYEKYERKKFNKISKTCDICYHCTR